MLLRDRRNPLESSGAPNGTSEVNGMNLWALVGVWKSPYQNIARSGMTWLCIQISLNRWLCNHRSPDNCFWSHPRRNLRLCSRQLRLWRCRWLSWAWNFGFLCRKTMNWFLRVWSACPKCSGWSPRLVPGLRRARWHSTLRRWNGRGLWSLRYGILHR